MTKTKSRHGLDILAEVPDLRKPRGKRQGYLVFGFLSILSEKSRFGDRSDSGKS